MRVIILNGGKDYVANAESLGVTSVVGDFAGLVIESRGMVLCVFDARTDEAETQRDCFFGGGSRGCAGCLLLLLLLGWGWLLWSWRRLRRSSCSGGGAFRIGASEGHGVWSIRGIWGRVDRAAVICLLLTHFLL